MVSPDREMRLMLTQTLSGQSAAVMDTAPSRMVIVFSPEAVCSISLRSAEREYTAACSPLIRISTYVPVELRGL